MNEIIVDTHNNHHAVEKHLDQAQLQQEEHTAIQNLNIVDPVTTTIVQQGKSEDPVASAADRNNKNPQNNHNNNNNHKNNKKKKEKKKTKTTNNNNANERKYDKYNELFGVGPDDETLVYRSGIPTLRSSTHRVKFSLKNRKSDPNPKDRNGTPTGTIWLPKHMLKEDFLSYDTKEYDFAAAIQNLLQQCCDDKVGTFRDNGNDIVLEDFCVPTPSVWRTINGGCCEEAQKVLSDQVMADEAFLNLFDRFVENIVVPYVKQRLLSAGVIVGSSSPNNDNEEDTTTQELNPHNDDATTNTSNENNIIFYCQRPPTMRLQPGPARAGVKPHADSEYGHQMGELNFWLPLTSREITKVDLWCESEPQSGDYHPLAANYGQLISFHGSSCRHFVNRNLSHKTRISLDFRIGVEGYFDPYWQMKGTTHDHGRKEIRF